MKSIIRLEGFWIIILVVLTLGVATYLTYDNWNTLNNGEIAASTVIHDISFVVGGVIAILLALWRGRIAERQSKTAQLGLLNERYQKGAEMLGDENLSVRLGGIYALGRLAGQHPNEYHTQIMSLLCAFARNLPKMTQEEEAQRDTHINLSEEVRAVSKAIRDRSKAQTEVEENENYHLVFDGAPLYLARLRGADLNKARFVGARLDYADLIEADLTSSHP